MTLYYFTNDTIGISNATGAFLQNWPIFNASNFVVPASLNAANFSTITRSDGLKQATYKGWPLYYYAKDQVAGDTLGNGVGSVWFVINPADFPPPPLTTTPPPTITPPADGGGGGY
jgi:predicted lipoprotein with Yx(FWY)xxD motif